MPQLLGLTIKDWIVVDNYKLEQKNNKWTMRNMCIINYGWVDEEESEVNKPTKS